tara:strand:+ start:5118 stop:5420 length:303 start_codon:yes stop_codon:yes gene_type:complete
MKIELVGILVGLSLSGFAFGIVSLFVSCLAWSTVVGLKNSTHQVQYVPIDNPNVNDDDEEADFEGEFDTPLGNRQQKTPKTLQQKYDSSMGYTKEEDEYI